MYGLFLFLKLSIAHFIHNHSLKISNLLYSQGAKKITTLDEFRKMFKNSKRICARDSFYLMFTENKHLCTTASFSITVTKLLLKISWVRIYAPYETIDTLQPIACLVVPLWITQNISAFIYLNFIYVPFRFYEDI